MSEHMKKHRINAHSHGDALVVSYHRATYVIPKNIANRYLLEEPKTPKKKSKKKQTEVDSVEQIFAKLDQKYTKAGALLKGLRYSENLTQVEFAKRIDVTQANLSAMENGKRPIGKVIAKRIQKVFGANYRYFLE